MIRRMAALPTLLNPIQPPVIRVASAMRIKSGGLFVTEYRDRLIYVAFERPTHRGERRAALAAKALF
jgi:hypothetical protein